jgi:hypothetical protein
VIPSHDGRVSASFHADARHGAVTALGVLFLAGFGLFLLLGGAVMAHRIWAMVHLLVVGVRVRATVVGCWRADDHDTSSPEYWMSVDYDTASGVPARDVRLTQPLPFRPPDGSVITVRHHPRAPRQAAPVDVRILVPAVFLLPLCLVSGAGFLTLAAAGVADTW